MTSRTGGSVRSPKPWMQRSTPLAWTIVGSIVLVDQPPLKEDDGQAPHREAEADDDREVADVGPALPSERRIAHELDAVVERIELAQHLRPLGQLGEREEGAGHEEERREDRGAHVAEAVDRLDDAGDHDPAR